MRRTIQSLLILTSLIWVTQLQGQVIVEESRWQEFENVANRFKVEEHPDVDQVAHFIKERNLEPQEEAALAYTLVAIKMQYDIEAFLEGRIFMQTEEADPNSVWLSGKTVCSGYVLIYKTILERLQIRCLSVRGYSKSSDDQPVNLQRPDHEWVIAFLDNQWVPIDPTWASGAFVNGNYQQQFSKDWFAVNPAKFLESHLPSAPYYQLLSCPLGVKEWSEGTAMIRKMTEQKRKCTAIQDSVEAYAKLPEALKPLHEAERAYHYNPVNTLDLGMAYLNYAVHLSKNGIPQKVTTRPQAEKMLANSKEIEAVTLKAIKWLNKSETREAKVALQVANGNLEAARKNQEAAQTLIRRLR